MRAREALDALVSTVAVALIAIAVAITLAKVWPGFPREGVRDVVIASIVAVTLRAIRAALRRLPKYAGALALDVHHAYADRLTSALSFAGMPEEARTPLMNAAIDDACERSAHLSPRKAAPFFWPRDGVAALGLGLGVAVLALIQVRLPVPLAQVKTIQPVVLSADDIDLFREVGKKLAETDKSPEVLAALQAYNQLVEDLAQKRLDRTEAFRRMHEIESRLMEGRALDAKELEEQLKRRAAALKKSELSRPAADALEKQDFAKAEKELRDLAKKMREKPDAFQKAQLEKLRDAMKKAAEGQKERLAALEQRREELRQQLLMQKNKNPDGGVSEEERSLLQKKERELERLDRETESEQRASRKLDRLDRDLEKAAEDLMKELGLSADDLDQGAEDINRMSEEKMSDEEREELRQRLEDLREQLRQEGQGGAQRMARLRRFVRQARGEGQGQGKGQGQGQQGEQEQDGEGEEGQGQKGQGQGQGNSEQEIFTIGPGGQKILVMSKSQRPGSGQSGQGQGNDPGQGGQEPGGDDKGGKSAGHGHDPNISGKATDPKMGTLSVQAAGLDTGQGASRSEVILGAAERGFKGGGYKKVYTEYRTSAEEQMHRDQIPPGAGDHVRRYFDLIRPRE
ncbi:MAG: hypothetical protein ABW133_13690 [Polyangiaceae bacterium]